MRIFLHPESQVSVKFSGQSVRDMARCDILAVTSEERAVIYSKCHRHRRLVDSYTRQSLGRGGIGHGVTDFKALNAYESTYITALHALYLFASHALKDMQLLDTLLDGGAVLLHKHDVLTLAELATMHTPYGDTAYVA